MNGRDFDRSALVARAIQAREKAYCPYSRFAVGAALLTSDGRIYTGCNIENASFTAGICAERTALHTAVAEGNTEFTAIAIAGGKEGDEISEPCLPCGVCRQALSEFAKDGFTVLTATADGFTEYTFRELFPHTFKL